jgi:hypothetical protein
MKKCGVCSIEKSLEEFTRDSKKADGKNYRCKVCDKVSYGKRKDSVCARAKDRYNPEAKRAYYLENKDKKNQQSRQYRLDNLDKLKDYQKQYNKENKEYVSLRGREYYSANKTKIDSRTKEYLKEYCKNNKAKLAAKAAKRRAAKLQRTPKWLSEFDLQYITHLYIQARQLTLVTGIVHEVDHIYPILGETVSGLHCPLNLQIITRTENRSKINKICPEYL